MKFMASLFLVFIIHSCSTDLPRFIPEDFDYPNNKIGAGKTYVYRNRDSSQYHFNDIKIINDQGYRSIRNYGDDSIGDSIITYNGRTIEVYNFFLSRDRKGIKGEKLQDIILSNNDKLGKHLTEWSYRAPKILCRTRLEEEYVKDTTINWQSHPLECLVTRATGILRYRLSNSNYQTTYAFKYYYAKGIGVIRYSNEFTDHYGKYHSNTWDLVSIKAIQ